jgi:CubicO group peptidase (beta-lactamase class C family)
VLLIAVITGCTRSDDAATTTTTVSSATAATVTTTTIPVAPDEDQIRRDRLVEWLDEQREAAHIPGLAFAVVQDDEIVLAEGLGFADVDDQAPVTPDTLFPIGSSTKAFTATLTAMLVDDGVVAWDDPVVELLPYFSPEVESYDPDAEATLRDLLSHRTGFVRMNVLIGNADVSTEQILTTAAGAEPWAEFRREFYYSNVMYTAAGTATAAAAGTSWTDLVEDRILDPLGMDHTTTSSSAALDDERLATGYGWEDDLQSLEPIDFHRTDNICPAGCLSSTVLDMAEWLRLQLGRGEVDGVRLVTEAQLDETWSPQIGIGGGISYGLGWIIGEWDGRTQLSHGGNISGFSAQVAMLPESNLGFVMLTNISISTLQDLVIPGVWEALLGDLEEDDNSRVDDLGPFVGEYVADFGQFRDERFEVLIHDGQLAVDIPRQQVFQLLPPDEEGTWQFAISDDIAVAFVRDPADQVVVMELYQSGLRFELPRVGYVPDPEIPLDELEPYLGDYSSERLDSTVTVLIRNNRLALDWPGEMVFEFHAPTDAGVWVSRVSDAFQLEFDETADGDVEGLTYRQPGFEARFDRVAQSATPSIEAVLALRPPTAEDALTLHSAFRLTGTLTIPQSGVVGDYTTLIDGADRIRIEQDFGVFGEGVTIVTADGGRIEGTFGPDDSLHGDELEQVRQGHPLALVTNWSEFFDEVAVLRATTLDESDVFIVTLRRGDLPPVTAFVDAATGDVVRTEEMILVGAAVMVPVTTVYEDFRDVAGMRIPFRITSSNDQTGSAIIEIETVEFDLDADPAWFAPAA